MFCFWLFSISSPRSASLFRELWMASGIGNGRRLPAQQPIGEQPLQQPNSKLNNEDPSRIQRSPPQLLQHPPPPPSSHRVLIWFFRVFCCLAILKQGIQTENSLCMNALEYFRELIVWMVSHVNDADMFLVQSVVTCGALFWYVTVYPLAFRIIYSWRM